MMNPEHFSENKEVSLKEIGSLDELQSICEKDSRLEDAFGAFKGAAEQYYTALKKLDIFKDKEKPTFDKLVGAQSYLHDAFISACEELSHVLEERGYKGEYVKRSSRIKYAPFAKEAAEWLEARDNQKEAA